MKSRATTYFAALSTVMIAAGLVACGQLWHLTTAPSSMSPQATFSCALGQARTLGYTKLIVVDSSDQSLRRLEARKSLPLSANGPDATEVSRQDVLEVRVKPASEGSTVTIKAGTLSLQETRRGPTEVVEPANYAARVDADTVLAHCRTPNAS